MTLNRIIKHIVLVGTALPDSEENRGKYIGFELDKSRMKLSNEPMVDAFGDYRPTSKLYNNSWIIYRYEP